MNELAIASVLTASLATAQAPGNNVLEAGEASEIITTQHFPNAFNVTCDFLAERAFTQPCLPTYLGDTIVYARGYPPCFLCPPWSYTEKLAIETPINWPAGQVPWISGPLGASPIAVSGSLLASVAPPILLPCGCLTVYDPLLSIVSLHFLPPGTIVPSVYPAPTDVLTVIEPATNPALIGASLHVQHFLTDVFDQQSLAAPVFPTPLGCNLGFSRFEFSEIIKVTIQAIY